MPLGAYWPDPQNPQYTILTGDPTILTSLGFLLTGWGNLYRLPHLAKTRMS